MLIAGGSVVIAHTFGSVALPAGIDVREEHDQGIESGCDLLRHVIQLICAVNAMLPM